MRLWRFVLVLLILSAEPGISQIIGPQFLSVQGRLLDPQDNPVEAAAVEFRLEIYSPGSENCLLYRETQSLNMSNSGGLFHLKLGIGTRSGSDFADTSEIADVVSNRTSFTGLSCDSGTSFTPAASMGRQLQIHFDDGSANGPQSMLTRLDLAAVPYALNADKVGGRGADELLHAVDTQSQTRLQDLLALRWTNLDALLNGTSSLYTSSTPSSSVNFNSQVIQNIASPILATDAVNKDYSDTRIAGQNVDSAGISALGAGDNGKILTWNGSEWTASSASFTVDCTADAVGLMRFNSTSGKIEYCNSTGPAWTALDSSLCNDTTPNAYAFTAAVNQTANTAVESNIIAIAGINCAVPVSISGGNSSQYRICADSSCSSVIQDWVSSPQMISAGQFLQVRTTTALNNNQNSNVQVFVGGGGNAWIVKTTGSCTDPDPSPGTLCADGTVYVGNSPDGGAKMYTTPCAYGQTWNGVDCFGTATSSTWNNGASGSTITGAISESRGEANTATLISRTGGDTPFAAAEVCSNLVANGYNDWYLPASLELAVIGVSMNAYGMPRGPIGRHWSSREASTAHAYFLDMEGRIGTNGKILGYPVRCVRKD